MNFKKILIVTLLFLAGCGKPADSEVVPSAEANTEDSKAGPYTVEFGGPELVYEHTMKGYPNNTEGKVEYFITTAEKAKITLVKTELKVTGCSASQVTHQTFWLPDANVSEGQLVMTGMSFQPQQNVKGVLLHSIRGLDGCTEVELLTSLKMEKILKPNPTFPVGQACEGTTGDSCKVQVYCREQDPFSSYVEVEVWKRSWGIELKKFMKYSDGTRNLMVSEMASESVGAFSYSYVGSTANLYFNSTTGVGKLNEKVGGQTYPTDLDCGWL